MIPAGFYTGAYSGPMGLPQGLPYFHLTGPGVDLLQNLNEGGTDIATDRAVFQPSSSYSWTDDAQPGVVHTFATTSNVVGTPGTTPISPVKGAGARSQDVVGSDVVPLRGTLHVTVGPLEITLSGKAVATLKAGRYRVVAARGLTVRKAGRAARAVTSRLVLTPGRWTFAAGGRTVVVAVR